ncbi:VOC family protein [Marinococcus halotolerans]|uniref:VOC family protein n=1 Tax=Marinococcus halotolerans TaxID=301092 RepID=UPI0003B412C7|nr:VOC family protein [Marinococcus halotolerans]
MKTVAYLQFDGQAEEALTFYEQALQATSIKKVRFNAFGQNPGAPFTDKEQNMIMESRIEFRGNTLMLSDVPPSMQAITGIITRGNSLLISIIDAEPEVNEPIFRALSEDGTVLMPLSSTPWSSSFGIVIDKFGVMWKFNSEASKFLNSFVN